MRMPDVGTTARRLVMYFGLHLLAALGVNPETAALAALWRQVLDALKAALGLSEAATERRVMARAAQNYADAQWDEAVRDIASAARSDLHGHAEGPDWERLFHPIPSAVVRLPIAEEIAASRRMEAELASGAMWTSARGRLARLVAARERLERANADHVAAVAASDEADHRMGAVVERWRTEYRAVFGGLTQLYPNRTAIVDSFFWREEHVERSEETPATPPANG